MERNNENLIPEICTLKEIEVGIYDILKHLKSGLRLVFTLQLLPELFHLVSNRVITTTINFLFIILTSLWSSSLANASERLSSEDEAASSKKTWEIAGGENHRRNCRRKAQEN